MRAESSLESYAAPRKASTAHTGKTAAKKSANTARLSNHAPTTRRIHPAHFLTDEVLALRCSSVASLARETRYADEKSKVTRTIPAATNAVRAAPKPPMVSA